MANVKAQFEQIDQSGSTVCYDGTVGTTAINLPSVADKHIVSIIVINPPSNSASDILEVSPDFSTCYVPICKKGSFSAKIRGTQKQIKIKSQAGTIDYKVVINYETTS